MDILKLFVKLKKNDGTKKSHGWWVATGFILQARNCTLYLNLLRAPKFIKVRKHMKIDAKRLEEFIKFGIVGGSGVLVNMGLLYALTRFLSIRLEIASPIAIWISILTNFFLNNLWTFKKRETIIPFWSRLFRYHLVSGLAGLVNYVILLLLVNLMGMHDLLSNLIGIAVGTVINYSLNSFWTWRVRSS